MFKYLAKYISYIVISIVLIYGFTSINLAFADTSSPAENSSSMQTVPPIASADTVNKVKKAKPEQKASSDSTTIKLSPHYTRQGFEAPDYHPPSIKTNPANTVQKNKKQLSNSMPVNDD